MLVRALVLLADHDLMLAKREGGLCAVPEVPLLEGQRPAYQLTSTTGS
jgi:hypothetical protein